MMLAKYLELKQLMKEQHRNRYMNRNYNVKKKIKKVKQHQQSVQREALKAISINGQQEITFNV